MSATLELAKALIEKKSITPDDAGCQDLIIRHLLDSGFSVEKLHFGNVDNLWARRGNDHPVVVFAGHTDVVPPGPLEAWHSDPFTPTIRDGHLFGRGAADMKASLGAMVIAAENFIKSHPDHPGSIAFLITSDEEGASIDGTDKVVEHLMARKEKIDYCIIGEASSVNQLGDMIKIGRRGTLSGDLTIHGIQGHIAYPQKADNPIHKVAPALLNLIQTEWDQGNDYFQPTSFQFSNIQAGTGAGNVIPGELHAKFNFRYSPELSSEEIRIRVEDILRQHQVDYSLAWHHSGKPFLTKPGKLVEATKAAIHSMTDIFPELSTHGGTSDGRFIAQMGCEIVEVGPINESIHKINECVNIADLEKLTVIFEKILENLLLS
jgi:succinyl-diaminopimelate desuccinylase